MVDNSTFSVLQRHRDALYALAARYGISNIRVFGSVARGDERPDSDIDLLVHLEKGYNYLDVGGFQIDTSELFGKKVDIMLDTAIHRYIRDQVLSEARPV